VVIDYRYCQSGNHAQTFCLFNGAVTHLGRVLDPRSDKL
jgi:hypothetical protein